MMGGSRGTHLSREAKEVSARGRRGGGPVAAASRGRIYRQRADSRPIRDLCRPPISFRRHYTRQRFDLKPGAPLASGVPG